MRSAKFRGAIVALATVALTLAVASSAAAASDLSMTTRVITAADNSVVITVQSSGDAAYIHGNANPWTSPIDPSGTFYWFNKPVTITDFAFPDTVNGPVTFSGATFGWNTGTGYTPQATLAGPYLLENDGVYSIVATGTDTVADVTGTVEPAFGIDQSDPVVTTDRVPFYAGTPVVTISATDSVSGIENVLFSVDGARNQSWEPTSSDPANFSASFPFAGQGNHIFSWTAFDNAGNTTHGTETFVVDNTAPVTTCDAAANYVGDATFHLSATDNSGGSGVAHTYHILDGAPQAEGNTVFVTAPVSGTASHTIEYWSVDAVGNVESPYLSKTFHVGHKLATSTTLQASVTSIKSKGYITLTAKLSGGTFAPGTTINFERRGSASSSYVLAKTVAVSPSGIATYRYRVVGKGTRFHRVRFLGNARYLPAPVLPGIKLVVK